MFPDQQNQSGAPQPNAQGRYDVVPPLPAGQNAGHSGHNPYEFIVNPTAPKHKRSPLTGGNSFFMKIGLLVGGAVLLMIVAAVIINAVAPKSNTAGLTTIAQRQQEIVRIATLATENTKNDDTTNFVTTTEVSVASSQQQLMAYLASHGSKLGDKTLALARSAQTDKLLENANTAGTYDSTVLQTLHSQLQTYENLLQAAYNQASNAQLKQLLKADYSSTVKLVDQAKSINPTDS